MRKRFLVGGASFNALKDRPAQSRRVEFRLVFRDQDEALSEPGEIPWDEDVRCPIDKEPHRDERPGA